MCVQIKMSCAVSTTSVTLEVFSRSHKSVFSQLLRRCRITLYHRSIKHEMREVVSRAPGKKSTPAAAQTLGPPGSGTAPASSFPSQLLVCSLLGSLALLVTAFQLGPSHSGAKMQADMGHDHSAHAGHDHAAHEAAAASSHAHHMMGDSGDMSMVGGGARKMCYIAGRPACTSHLSTSVAQNTQRAGKQHKGHRKAASVPWKGGRGLQSAGAAPQQVRQEALRTEMRANTACALCLVRSRCTL